MMTVPADGYPTEPQIDYKVKYKALKKKLRLLVYEHECFLEELRKAQRKLLKVARDRSFLLDRLIQYEKVDDSSGDSDATASSDSDGEHKDGSPHKKRKLNLGNITVPPEFAHLVSAAALSGASQGAGGSHDTSKKRSKSSNKKSKSGGNKGGKQPGQMTREELERHLDSRQPSFGLEKAPANLPMDIFNNDNSNQDSDLGLLIGEEEDDLVIDVPQ